MKLANFPHYKEIGCDTPKELKEWIIKQPKWIQINLKKKRNRIKFEKNPWKYISPWVKAQYMGFVLSIPVRRKLDYVGISGKFLITEPWPEGEPIIFDN